MKIRMLNTANGCDNGYTLSEYKAGHVYDVSQDLARCFISTNDAEPYKEAPKLEPKKHK